MEPQKTKNPRTPARSNPTCRSPWPSLGAHRPAGPAPRRKSASRLMAEAYSSTLVCQGGRSTK
eukprot:1292031-Pyramimonas_sp.AAC.1